MTIPAPRILMRRLGGGRGALASIAVGVAGAIALVGAYAEAYRAPDQS